MNVLITGAASNIGFDVAENLAKRGHFVYLTTHKEKEIDVVTRKLSSKNIKCFAFDIEDEASYKVLDDLELDCVILHAGICEGGSLLDMGIDNIRKNFDVNFLSTVSLIKYILPRFIDRNNARILVTSSLAGYIPIPFLGSYAITKASLSLFIKDLRYELKIAGSKMQIGLIEPGIYNTGFNDIMIDKNSDYLKESIYFRDKALEITKTLKGLFNFLGKNSNKSIVKCFIKGVETSKVKKVYRAPFLSRCFLKIYFVLFG